MKGNEEQLRETKGNEWKCNEVKGMIGGNEGQ